eukprot:gene7733-9063_t
MADVVKTTSESNTTNITDQQQQEASSTTTTTSTNISVSPPNNEHSLSPGSLSPSNTLLPGAMMYPEESEKNLAMRTKIIDEIIETERDYVRDLQIVQEVFVGPIKEKELLSVKDANMLFSNIEVLLSINQTMLAELERDDEPSHYSTKVGQAFLKMSHYLKMYNAYCSNQHTALKLLEEEKDKNEPFRLFLDGCMADPRCRGLPLLSFIIKPVQKRRPLEEADTKIGGVVTSINEGKRTIEMFQKILELQQSIENIDDDLVKPGRSLLQDANVTSVRELSSDGTLQRTIFLFTDLILVCGPASHSLSNAINFKSRKYIYRLKGRIPIVDARVMFVADTDSVKYALELCNLKDNKENKFILCFNTEQQRSQWLKQIKTMIQEHKFSSAKRGSRSLGGPTMGITKERGSPATSPSKFLHS